MKFVALSDLHIHNYQRFNQDGNRLLNSLSVLDDTFKLASDVGTNYIIFPGDLFHQQKNLPTAILDPTIRRFRNLFKQYPEMVVLIISGNHDHSQANLLDKPSNTALTHLSNIYSRFIILDNKMMEFDRIKIYGVPYYTHRKDLLQAIPKPDPNVFSILMLHNTPESNSELIPYDFTLEEVDDFDLVLCGHIHTYQKLNQKVYLVGSPLWQNFNSRGDKGLLVIDTEKNTVDRHLLDYPKYEKPVKKLPDYIKSSSTENFDLSNSYESLLESYAKVVGISDKFLAVGNHYLSDDDINVGKVKSELIIKSVTMEGFVMYSEERVFPFEEGFFILKGPNEVGKTTIFSAVTWGLTGKSLRPVVNSKLVTKPSMRHTGFKGTRVMVVFEKDGVEYLVARHIKYKGDTKGYTGNDSLFIFQEGELLQNQHKIDNQKNLEAIIQMDYRVFTNSVIFGQKMQRFTELSNTGRRELYESIFNLDWINLSRIKVGEDQVKYNEEIISLENEMTGLQSSLITHENNFKSIQLQIDSFEKNKQDSIDNLEAKITTQEKELSGLEEESRKELQTKLDKYQRDKSDLQDINSKIDKVLSDKSLLVEPTHEFSYNISPPVLATVKDVCDHCGSPIKDAKKQAKLNQHNYDKALKKYEEDKLKALKDYDDEFNLSVSNYNTKLNEINQDLELLGDKQDTTAIESKIHAVISSISKVDANNDKIKFHHKNIIDYNTELAKLKSQTPNTLIEEKSKVFSLMVDIKTKFPQIAAKINKKTLVLEALDYWYGEGFSNKGLKSFIINQSLNSLNKELWKYSTVMGVGIKCFIDFEKTTKPFIIECNRDGILWDYNEFSGGASSMIDLSVAFALHDVVSSNIKCNLFALDEVFKFLDLERVEEVFELVRMKQKGGKALYIITHRQDIDAVGTKTIEL